MQVLLLVLVDLSGAFYIVESIVLQDETGAQIHTPHGMSKGVSSTAVP